MNAGIHVPEMKCCGRNKGLDVDHLHLPACETSLPKKLRKTNTTSTFNYPSRAIVMSTASKLKLAATLTSTIGIVAFVHWEQKSEKAAMHAGVLRDEENQRRKKAEQEERRLDFEMQKQLEQQYLKTQTVHDSTSG